MSAYHLAGYFYFFQDNWKLLLITAIPCFFVELVIFWIGILLVYCTSRQLGIRLRVWGILCGPIPVAHIVLLLLIIAKCSEEVKFEYGKIELDDSRKNEQICATKYPVLLVHGVFFRDFKYFNYWGRIPEALKQNGANLFYGNHESALSVEDSGKQLAERIKRILEETGAQKVNIIAHSKGGLDCRYAISCCGMAPYIASLTTVNTPHRGCEFADYLLTKIPEKQKQQVAAMYNGVLLKMGDKNPDFIAAVTDLTATQCAKLNSLMPDSKEVYYQSIGSKLNKASNGRFPLNFSYHLVDYFDGPNDGLVSEHSFKWGEAYQFLTVAGKRGISHADVIDLNRENFPGFDVREFYVQLVAELKDKGF